MLTFSSVSIQTLHCYHFLHLLVAGDYCESKQALVSTKPRSVGARGAAGTSGSLSAAPHGSGTDMISKMKDQLDATTEMCQHLLQEQRKLSLKLSGMNFIIWQFANLFVQHHFKYANMIIIVAIRYKGLT